MKKDRTRLIIGILLSLVLFSSSVGLWLYSKEKNMDKEMQKMRYVYVMAKNVKKGTKISDEDIKLEKYPQQIITWNVPKKGNILHRYAKTDLYKGEPLMSSKLSIKPIVEKKIVANKPVIDQEEQNLTVLNSFKGDSITLPLKSFHNIDPTLRKGDKIDIVSIDASLNALRKGENIKTKYAALGVTVLSFGYGTSLYKKIVKKVLNKNRQVAKTLFADTITLAVTPENVKNLLALYYKTKALNAQRPYNDNNKGHLWLVKSKIDDENILKEKEKLLLDYKKAQKKRSYKKPQSVRIEYEK